MDGLIHSYESLAALDGIGLRYCIFMAGCPLRCVYCHNPDTQRSEGEWVSTENMVKKIMRYKPYFGKDGGVTFSGGEPLMQSDFLTEAVNGLIENGIPYAIDTSGAVPLTESVCFVLDNAQTVILDIKLWDDETYVKYTGASIKNTLLMAEYLDENHIPTWIRTVIVPGINDSEEAIAKYAELVRQFKCVEKYELLGFHTMGFQKYEAMVLDNPLKNTQPLPTETLKRLQNSLDQLRK